MDESPAQCTPFNNRLQGVPSVRSNSILNAGQITECQCFSNSEMPMNLHIHRIHLKSRFCCSRTGVRGGTGEVESLCFQQLLGAAAAAGPPTLSSKDADQGCFTGDDFLLP